MVPFFGTRPGLRIVTEQLLERPRTGRQDADHTEPEPGGHEQPQGGGPVAGGVVEQTNSERSDGRKDEPDASRVSGARQSMVGMPTPVRTANAPAASVEFKPASRRMAGYQPS